MATFFISYTGADLAWAEWIAWQLEDAGHEAIIQAWDFRPGMNFVLEMDVAMKADHTIAVLSPSYIEAVFTRPEWANAFAEDATGRQRKLIPVLVYAVDLAGIFKSIIYVDLVGKDESAARDELLAGIAQGRAKPSEPVLFPGKTSHPSFPGGSPTLGRVADISPAETFDKARLLIQDRGRGQGPALRVAIVPASSGRLVRPTIFDDQPLSGRLVQEALFQARILDQEAASPAHREPGIIEVCQPRASFRVNDSGEIVVTLAATARGNLAIIEEDLLVGLKSVLDFGYRALEILEAGVSVPGVAIAARVEGAEYTGWMTRAEHQASPNRTTIPGFGRKPGAVDLGRLHSLDELSGSRGEIARELVALLRREVHG